MADADDKSVRDRGKKEEPAVAKEKHRGFLSRIWNGIFRINDDDFEKRLQHLSKVEADFLARSKWRSQTGRRITRHLFAFFVISTVIAVGYAFMILKSLDSDWEIEPFLVLKIFLPPGLCFAFYFACDSFTRTREGDDQKILERLHAEKQAKIDELKEKTNYYTTLKLIQKYDPDPAAKAAAATILASKLRADSGLKVFLQDEPKLNVSTWESNDVEVVQSSGLRSRKASPLARSCSAGSNTLHHSNNEKPFFSGNEVPRSSENNHLVVVDHHPPSSYIQEASWVAKLATLLVGDDPTQSYALICGNCHKHNGLARKEDYPHITYYCPHCRALNRPKQAEEHALDSGSPNASINEASGIGDELKRTKSSIN